MYWGVGSFESAKEGGTEEKMSFISIICNNLRKFNPDSLLPHRLILHLLLQDFPQSRRRISLHFEDLNLPSMQQRGWATKGGRFVNDGGKLCTLS